MGKRRNGEGTWGKKTIKGIKYYYYRDHDLHYTYGRTEAEVRQKLKDNESKKKKKTGEIRTIGDYVRDWFYRKKFLEVGVSIQSTTFDTYERCLNGHFFDYDDYPLAKKQLCTFSPEILQKYIKSLAAKFSKNTISFTWILLKMCFTDEDYDKYPMLPKISYRSIRIPSESNIAKKTRDVQFVNAEDMDIIYNAVMEHPDTCPYCNAAKLIVFLAYTGLRATEGCGLKWRDVDLESGCITIRQIYTETYKRNKDGGRDGSNYIDKSPKTKTSCATIPYRKRAEDVLRLMDELYPDHKDDDYVFMTSNGTPYRHHAVLITFRSMMKWLGLSDRGYTLHSLRHGYGSVLYQEGVDLKTISKLLRHSRIQTTANIYIDVTNDTLKDALDKVDGKDR